MSRECENERVRQRERERDCGRNGVQDSTVSGARKLRQDRQSGSSDGERRVTGDEVKGCVVECAQVFGPGEKQGAR